MRNPLVPSLALAVLLGLPGPVLALDAAEEVTACIRKNVPEKTSEQFVEFTAVDRLGSKRVSRAKIIGKRMGDGLRRVRMRFTKPNDLRGSALLIIEIPNSRNDIFLYSPELRKTKRVTAAGVGGSLFGTDFTAEDFERWQNMNQPGQHKRGPDSDLEGRAVHVLETVPAAQAESAYESVLSYVDQETCVVLKTESFEPGKRLRKVLTARVDSLLQEAGIWVASELVMEDLRDRTHTDVVVEDLEVDGEISDRELMPSRLDRQR